MTGPALASVTDGSASGTAQPFDLTSVANLQGYGSSLTSVSTSALQRLISSASKAIQSYLGYDVQNGSMLAATSYTEEFDAVDDGMGWPNQWVYEIPVRWPPIQSVSALSIDGVAVPSGGNAINTPGYFIDPDKPWQICSAGYFPCARGVKNIVATYVGGFVLIPEDIEQACIEMVLTRLATAGRIGVKSQAMPNIGTTVYDTAAMSAAVRAMIQPYVRVGLG
jgi:hypothetical protein